MDEGIRRKIEEARERMQREDKLVEKEIKMCDKEKKTELKLATEVVIRESLFLKSMIELIEIDKVMAGVLVRAGKEVDEYKEVIGNCRKALAENEEVMINNRKTIKDLRDENRDLQGEVNKGLMVIEGHEEKEEELLEAKEAAIRLKEGQERINNTLLKKIERLEEDEVEL